MVIVAGWWYLLWFFSVHAALHAKEKESRGATNDEALRRQYARALSHSHSSLVSFFRIASLISWKKALPVRAPFDHLYRSFVDSSILNDHPLLNVLLFFIFLSLLQISRSHSQFLPFFFFFVFPLFVLSCQKASLLPMPRMQKSWRKYPLIVP